VVAQSLAKDPADRYPSAETMAQALEQRRSASHERPAVPDDRSQSSPARLEDSRSGETARTNHRAALILGAVTLLLIGILGAFSQNARNRHHSTTAGPTDTTPQTNPVVPPVQTGSSGSTTSSAGDVKPSSARKASDEIKTADESGDRKADRPHHIARTTGNPAPKKEPESLAGERFPQTRLRRLSADEVRAWRPDDLRYAINEMYARHGYDFANRSLKEQFLELSWYRRALTPGRRDVSPFLSSIERQNRALMTRIRDTGQAGG
jgi:hypothetical protein